jgi:hypothetical protein
MSRTMLNGSLARSGRLRLEFAHHVVGAPSDLARNGEDGSFAADARGSLCMQSAVGAVGTLRMLGCFDQSPAQRRRAVLGQPAAAPRLAGLVDDRIEAGRAHRLTGAAEARCLAELGEQVTGEDRPDTRVSDFLCKRVRAVGLRSGF